MTEMILRKTRTLGLIATASFAFLLGSCQVFHSSNNCAEDEECHEHAKVCHNPTMHALASDLDQLESHIDKYGSVVAMQPSVWGQARLTKYRADFEGEMVKNLSKFTETLQGSVSRSDQIYAANALAISAAISGQQAYAAPAPRVTVQTNTTALTPIPVPDATPNADAFSGFSSISRTGVRTPLNIGFVGTGNTGVGASGVHLEPTILLDQQARYLNYLNQIRRNNEGDDTADSPGYSLNLVRIPVSVLPGKCTMQGCGAEITMTLTPVISDELLPTTFRQLVVNDLTEQLSLPVTKVIEDQKNVKEMRQVLYKMDEYYEKIYDLRRRIATNSATDNEAKQRWNDWYRDHKKEVTEAFHNASSDPRYKEEDAKLTDKLLKDIRKLADEKKISNFNVTSANNKVPTTASECLLALREQQLAALDDAYSAPSSQRIAPFAIPLSQLLDVFGVHSMVHVVDDINDSVASHLAAGKTPYHFETAAALHAELEAAYQLLAQESNLDLWKKHCTLELVEAIRNRNTDPRDNARGSIDELRHKFLDDLNVSKSAFSHSGAAPLAWAIIVESALLNYRLKNDVRKAVAVQGRPSVDTEQIEFFLPQQRLMTEAKQIFSDYVKTRWPIHVFAIDPMSADQNLADEYSRRQEMQLALSLAFASGNMNAKDMLRYARRIEEDMETIAINKTQVGFSHGSDTFGWRFYPRFQTPGFEGNAKVVLRDLLIGGPSKNEEIRQQRLEPGMRECVAIVMMPSFVPYVKCEVSSNWFNLTNPKHKEFTLTQAIHLGKTVKSVQTCWPNIQNANCYRDGDLQRLLTKVQQLEKRLPLQDMLVQVPYENTLGGFEMFNVGIANLAPRLRGWYGGSGVLDKQDTQLFLVGDHFNVHHTSVTAGGQDVKFELISRQVMKVTIPKGTTPNVREPEPTDTTTAAKPATSATAAPAASKPADSSTTPAYFKYVDIHVATPYGVSSHVEIPFIEVKDDTASKTGLDWNQKSVELGYVFSGNGIAQTADPKSWPPLTIKWDTKILGNPPVNAVTADLELTFDSPYSDTVTKAIKPPFPTQPIKLVGIDFTKLNAKTFELPIDSGALANCVFGVAPLPGAFGGFFSRTNPPVPIITSKVALTLKDAKGNPLTGMTNPIIVGSGLTVTWSHTPDSWRANVSCPPGTPSVASVIMVPPCPSGPIPPPPTPLPK